MSADTQKQSNKSKDSGSTCSESPLKIPDHEVNVSKTLAGLVIKTDHAMEKKLNKMKKSAWNVRENAYCPYSGFQVGAALRSAKTGKIYVGCNVENAAYPTGICAERGAVMTAIAAEGKNIKFDEVVIVTEADEPSAPCGPCR